MALNDVRTRARELASVPASIVSQGTGTTDAEYRCIQSALEVYNQDQPRELVLVISPSGGSVYEYSLSSRVSGWNASQYQVVRVVYPGNKQTENELDNRYWDVYEKSDGTFWLRFTEDSPASGNDVWVYYTAPHVIDPTTDTLSSDNPGDFQAFCHLAAAYILEMAANYYAKLDESSIGADSQNYRDVTQRYQTQANNMRKVYSDHISRKRGRTSAVINWDTTATGGRDRMFHRRRWN